MIFFVIFKILWIIIIFLKFFFIHNLLRRRSKDFMNNIRFMDSKNLSRMKQYLVGIRIRKSLRCCFQRRESCIVKLFIFIKLLEMLTRHKWIRHLLLLLAGVLKGILVKSVFLSGGIIKISDCLNYLEGVLSFHVHLVYSLYLSLGSSRNPPHILKLITITIFVSLLKADQSYVPLVRENQMECSRQSIIF